MRTHSSVPTARKIAGGTLLLLTTLALTAERGLGQPCVGDCNGDRAVTVDEEIVAINIAVGIEAMVACTALDTNANGAVTIDEIAASVFNALVGCDGTVGGNSRASSGSIAITSTTGQAGQVVPVSVWLDTAGETIAATQNDIAVSGLGAIAAKANGQPDCAANPAIGKSATSFAFWPGGCSPGSDCSGIRAIVIALDNLDPIPNGAVLYTCNVQIAPEAAGGETIFLTLQQPLASDQAANALLIGAASGTIEIGSGVATPTPTGPAVVAGSAVGLPGERVAFDVTLFVGTSGAVSTVQGDVLFNTVNSPIAAKGDGTPDCTVNPAINKNDSRFTFLSPGRMQALIFSRTSNDPIPDRAILYTCHVDIPEFAVPGVYALGVDGVILIDPAGMLVAGATGIPGEIQVNGPTPSPGPSPGSPSLILETVSGAPGETVAFRALLSHSGTAIAGLGVNIGFDPSYIRPAAANDKPDCTVNPAINKTGSSFAFFPPGCVHGVTCVQVQAYILPLENVDPIPNGPLFTCYLDIALDAIPGTEHVLVVSDLRLASPEGNSIPGGVGVNGRVIVVEIAGTPTPTGTPIPTETPTPTPIGFCSNDEDCLPSQTCDNGSCRTVTAAPTSTRTPVPSRTPTDTQPLCVGDCSGDGGVDIAELITGVGIALGNQAPGACPAFDADGSGAVDIGELITAVNNALRGCG